ncbi:ATP-binding cassette domain-containing protein, partial [Escherichia marmotae]
MLFERLDLRLAAGEMLQVVGPNGSGKTSLLR